MSATKANTQTADAGQNSAKHTPGPWKLDSQHGRVNVTKTADGIVSHVASCFVATLAEEHGGSAMANAELIASAPALLAERDALKAENERLRAALTDCHDCIYEILATPNSPEGRRGIIAINQARAALSAKGDK